MVSENLSRILRTIECIGYDEVSTDPMDRSDFISQHDHVILLSRGFSFHTRQIKQNGYHVFLVMAPRNV
ncbi:hypothetical protein Aeh1ORF149c [Aeromonas phage Aeh1]|uniref:Uncharacterized protein n=1 Tax=Aeromonas phage Aeh1 TaxID=2880362 RepID=Q76YT2_9CAUD|nr:hypothetical protein Aeh1p159 [Aeromonas phage Aeh1]AAQ17814.1 hypothetical protein Aeh1ORF149c [Aeromonas phage Aeh1]